MSDTPNFTTGLITKGKALNASDALIAMTDELIATLGADIADRSPTLRNLGLGEKMRDVCSSATTVPANERPRDTFADEMELLMKLTVLPLEEALALPEQQQQAPSKRPSGRAAKPELLRFNH